MAGTPPTPQGYATEAGLALALIANVAGRGLVVLTGCGHAGVISICRYAQRLTGTAKRQGVIGWFHLTGPPFEPIIADTARDLEHLGAGMRRL